MPRSPSRLLLPLVALIALVLLSPSLATALPLGQPGRSAAERPNAAAGLFTKLWVLLSAVWSTGVAAPGSEPNSGTPGNNGPGLDPNG